MQAKRNQRVEDKVDFNRGLRDCSFNCSRGLGTTTTAETIHIPIFVFTPYITNYMNFSQYPKLFLRNFFFEIKNIKNEKFSPILEQNQTN